MRYSKPTIADLGPASAVIQNHGTKDIVQEDANESLRPAHSTCGSYDLDE